MSIKKVATVANKTKTFSLKMTETDYCWIEMAAMAATKSTGKPTSMAWVILKLMEIGKSEFERQFIDYSSPNE